MFRVNVATAEILFYDSIGASWLNMIDDVLVADALAELKGRRVTARFNSDGGDVFIAASIYNLLTRHDGGVDTTNDGLAASAASYLFLAGENRTAARNSTFMSHRPWSMAIGDATQLRKTADVLDKVGGQMAQVYSERTGMSMSQVNAMLDAETWHTADEAVNAKLATGIGNVIVDDSAVASSVASFKASRGYPQKAKEDAQEVTPYRVAAKLKAIKLRNQFARSR